MELNPRQGDLFLRLIQGDKKEELRDFRKKIKGYEAKQLHDFREKIKEYEAKPEDPPPNVDDG